MSSLPGALYQALFEPTWPMLFLSGHFEELTGYRPDLFGIGGERSFGELIHPDDADRVWSEVSEAVHRREVFSCEYRLIDSDERERRVWDHGHGVFTADGALLCVEGLILDVSERALLERQLRQSQREQAIGRLSGVVAHDFNNFLTGIVGSLQLALEDLSNRPFGDPEAHIRLALDAADRAKNLARQLLLLSRGRPSRPQDVDVAERVGTLREFLNQVIGSPRDLRVELSTEPLWVKMDPMMLDQVLLNLVVNAKEAIDGHGTITVGARPSDSGEEVVLVVEDDGRGMDAETRREVFDPFFTTKENGTGLGLATVRSIAEDAGGQVSLRSRPGVGTVVSLTFPRAQESAVEPVEPSTEKRERRELSAQGEVVLIVDDDETVLRVAADVLQRFGYTTLEARSPGQARRVVERLGAVPDLAILDVSMPECSGIDLAAELRGRNLLDSVLFVSGYAAPEHEDVVSTMASAGYLEKPFSIDGLLEAVRTAIDEGRPSRLA